MPLDVRPTFLPPGRADIPHGNTAEGLTASAVRNTEPTLYALLKPSSMKIVVHRENMGEMYPIPGGQGRPCLENGTRRAVLPCMRLRNWVLAGVFLLLGHHFLTHSPAAPPAGEGTGIWRGRVSTVTARGAMLEQGLWVSSRELSGAVDRGDSLLVMGRVSGTFLTPWALRVKPGDGLFQRARRAVVARFRSSIHDSLALGLSAAVLTGSRGMVPAWAAETFRLSGTSHLLALSGMHTGIVAGFLLFLSRALLGRRAAGAVLAAGAIAAFVMLTGGRASTVRAGIMAGACVLWMAFRGGRTHPLSVWCIALAPVLSDPSLLDDTGARMSYGAVLSLILFARSWKGNLGRLVAPFWAGLVVIVSLAPLTGAVYGTVNPAGAVATVLSIPLMTGVMALALPAALGAGCGLLEWLCRLWLRLLGLFTGCGFAFRADRAGTAVWVALMALMLVVKRGKGFARRFR